MDISGYTHVTIGADNCFFLQNLIVLSNFCLYLSEAA